MYGGRYNSHGTCIIVQYQLIELDGGEMLNKSRHLICHIDLRRLYPMEIFVVIMAQGNYRLR